MIILIANAPKEMWYSDALGFLFEAYKAPELPGYFMVHYTLAVRDYDAVIVTKKTHRTIDEVRSILIQWQNRIESREAQKQVLLANQNLIN